MSAMCFTPSLRLSWLNAWWLLHLLIACSSPILEQKQMKQLSNLLENCRDTSVLMQKSQPTQFISFTNSFHGRTMGALALTSKEHYSSPFERVMPGVTFVAYRNNEATKKLIQRGKTAAVFVEPIQAKVASTVQQKNFYNFCALLVMRLELSWSLMRPNGMPLGS